MSDSQYLLSTALEKGESFPQKIEWGTWFSIICTMAGTGILQLPLTIQQGGWLCMVLMVIVALMTRTTGVWLIKLLYDKSSLQSYRRAGYPEIGKAAYGNCGKSTVQVFHKATLLGVTTIFLILAGKFLLEGMGGGGEGFLGDSIGSNSVEDQTLWMRRWTLVSAGIVWFPVVFIPTMKEVAPLAAFGLLATMLCVIEVIVFAFIIGPITGDRAAKYNLPTPPTFQNMTRLHPDKPVSYDWFVLGNFPTAFSAITMAFGGHAVFPSIEQHMEKPSNFKKTFDAAYIVLISLYLVVASAGYYTFGDITYSPILCNFPRNTSTPLGAITAVTKLMVGFHVMCAYPILMNVVTSELERSLHIGVTTGGRDKSFHYGDSQGVVRTKEEEGAHDEKWKLVGLRALLRTCLVGFTCFVAVMVPFFGDVMSLVGAMCLTMIVFVLPVVFSFKLRGEELSLGSKVWGYCIIFTGVLGGSIGTIQSLENIAKKLQTPGAQ